MDIDDTDDLDKEAEHEAWKLRELQRIKRDKEERDQYLREQEDLARRREMTDEQVRAEDEKLKPKKEKSQQRFLQKYFHKGAFYLDEDIEKRNFAEPTPEDMVDKTALPEVLQVKNFGKASRTKWTHLTNEDTTAVNSSILTLCAQA
jgi:microfibrillar-associated protein 1